ncbi:MAG: hypothetical protein Q7T25_00615, partial [Sideroxyarcus sp.]|nr:hypothetical protein [Sideroxyarcus sp.]
MKPSTPKTELQSSTQLRKVVFGAALVISFSTWVAVAQAQSSIQSMNVPDPTTASPQRVALAPTLINLPLSFEANQGQASNAVKFLARGQGYRLLLSSTEARLVLQKGGGAELAAASGTISRENRRQHREGSASVSIRLVGARDAPRMEGVTKLPGKVNYFCGNRPELWRTNIATFAKIKYSEVYPGVDLIFYGNQRQLEYDFVVAPGADPDMISMKFEGVDGLEIDGQGDLIIHVSGSEIISRAPVVHQELNGGRRTIPGRYVLRDTSSSGPGRANALVGFQVAAYDPGVPLVIDPVLSYSTFLGGNDGDFGYAMAIGSGGEIYVTGKTFSTNFPAMDSLQILNRYGNPGLTDAFVTKLNASGSALIYSTYLGGTGNDEGKGIAVESSGIACITGFTASSDFPTSSPIQSGNAGGTSDAFVAKLTERK